MTRSVGLSHVIRNPDRTASGVWGVYALRTAFQPIFAFAAGKLLPAAFEGLVRPFKNGVPVSPGLFFGMVPAPDRLHVETLSRTLHLINAGTFLPKDASVFVNFDPSVFTERAIADHALRDIRLVLHEAAIEPGRVVCEITEQRLSADSSLLYFIDALRAAGFRIAVDDYGAADSDIERVRAVKPDIVKFDAKWITRLMESGPGFALLAAMVEKFSGQAIATVFEGIEEGWQLELAERAGASMVQGYVLARPEIVPTIFVANAPRAGAPFAARPGEPLPTPAAAGPARPGRVFGKRAAPG